MENNKKAVYIASSANIMKVAKDKITKEWKADQKSGGGVAPGINDAIPTEGYKKNYWLGIMEAPEGFDPENDPDKAKAAIRSYEEKNNIPEGQNEFIFVEKETFDEFYKGATNGITWPLIHSMPEKIDPNRDLNSHTPVDWEFTETLLKKINSDINDDDKPEIKNYNDVVVWVHDYHVFQVPGMLKEAIQNQNDYYTKVEYNASQGEEPAALEKEKIVGEAIEGNINVSFFHHETWANIAPGREPEGYDPEKSKVFYMGKADASEERIATMNDRFKDILTKLVDSDSIGFHTQLDSNNFVQTIENFGIAANTKELEHIKNKCYVNPIGIPKARLEREFNERVPVLKTGLENTEQKETDFVKNLKQNHKAVVDSLDYMKERIGSISESEDHREILNKTLLDDKADIATKLNNIRANAANEDIKNNIAEIQAKIDLIDVLAAISEKKLNNPEKVEALLQKAEMAGLQNSVTAIWGSEENESQKIRKLKILGKGINPGAALQELSQKATTNEQTEKDLLSIKANIATYDTNAKVFESIKANPSKLINKMSEAAQKIEKGNASLHDYQTVMEKAYFNSEKVHIASVQRFDYTKGIEPSLNAYRDFLREKASTGVSNPGETYQFNLVTGAGRSSPIKAYDEYQQLVENQIKEINEEFPGAVYHYQQGIANAEMTVFDAMNDLQMATSIKDGYILSVGEMIDARNRALNHPDVETLLTHKASGAIISTGAGIAEDLGGLERKSRFESLSLEEPKANILLKALHRQTDNIDTLRGQQKTIDSMDQRTDLNESEKNDLIKLKTNVEANSGDYQKMVAAITDADTKFGNTAFAKIGESSKKNTANQEQADIFSKEPIKNYIVTDNDGTMTSFVPLERKDEAGPTKEALEKLRQYSFDNPDTGIAILSGRKNGELNNFYKEAMRPDTEGRRPKIVLASENGAFMQFKPIDSNSGDISVSNNRMHALAKPLEQELKDEIIKMMGTAAGNHFTTDSNDTAKHLWIKAEVKKYGFTAHYREPRKTDSPETDADNLKLFEAIKSEIKAGLKQIGEANEMEVHLGATNSYTIERVSKGTTLEDLANNTEKIQQLFQTQGLVTEKPLSMSYSGDDTGDRPALTKLNEKLAAGELKGYTSRPNNLTPYDPEPREPNGPEEVFVPDTFYILGSNEKTAQQMHQENFMDKEAFNSLNDLRESLSNAALMPGQNEGELPPIVLLDSDAILIQKPKEYPAERLANFASDFKGKVVLVADEQHNENLERLAREHKNLNVVTPSGKFYQPASWSYKTIGQGFEKAKDSNKVISTDPVRASEIQFLRAVQTLFNVQQTQLLTKQEQPKVSSFLSELANSPSRGDGRITPAAKSLKKENKPKMKRAWK
ncbi:hypothetical protein FGM00_11390 [Aggregatimonas sangjinii]|uniref:Uncharacterized protein n=1 Tax=Aggregatimonas sangjinii TaxID=2583587 RepID=A0A5B7SUU0_9FLAO|nr:trehalose-6-phosphate synthase [Aggregatimonas sangjinii]QCX00681.1 hypothetical protein FGM00_11390 [Aggregatimonas sangjinii]